MNNIFIERVFSMQRKPIIIGIGLVAVALGVFLFTGGNEKTVKNETAKDIKQMVQDYSLRKITAQSASITSQQLIVTAENSAKTTYDLPEDEFFVSIAPFVENTHPCEIHSLTGCQGEMVEQEFDINVVDEKGKTVLNQKMKSQSNGFVDLWLPRDQTYQVTIEYDGKTAKSEVSTFKDDNTCITTMQLS